MEVKIGVRDVPREVVLDTELTHTEVAAKVSSALKDETTLELTDDKGRLIIVPGSLIGYVEIGAPESRRVGFGA